MLALFRRFLDTWAARAFFIVLVASFALWGVADKVRNYGHDDAVATVGDHKIEAPEFQQAFRRQLTEVGRMLGGRVEPTPAMRRGIAEQTLDRLVTLAAISGEVRRLGLSVPDDALRQAVFEIPAFRNPAGVFDRIQFEAVLRNNNLTEPRFLDLVRTDLGQRQLMEAVQSGVTAPAVLLNQVFAFQREQRVADLVELPFTAAPEPGEPSEADLRRTYEDNPAAYSAPAFRRIQAVVLSPDTLARDIQVPDEDVAAYYEQHKAEYVTAEKRSVEVLVTQDEAVAQQLARAWIAGAGWAEMQKQVADAGGSSVVLDDATPAEIPAPDLATAVFAAAPDTVAGPVQTGFGWQVLRVTKVLPGTERPLAAATDDIRTKVARDRAADQVYARANQLEDALGAGTPLDRIPADLGAAGVAGTLDAQGNTPDGEPAPLPGSPALHQAIVTAAFAVNKGDPPRLTEGPEQSYFAVQVEDATPPAPKPFADVQARVRENWQRDTRRHAQEVVAAKLLAAAKAGSLDDAATIAGLRTQRTPPAGRSAPVPGVPQQLVEPLFSLKPNDATMVETPEGFVVAKLAEVIAPDPAADPTGAAQMRTTLAQALGQDIEVTYAVALRDRAKPRVNRAVLETLAQP